MEVGLLRLEVREGLLTEVRAGWGLCLDVGSGSDAKAGRGLCVTAARRPARLQRRERAKASQRCLCKAHALSALACGFPRGAFWSREEIPFYSVGRKLMAFGSLKRQLGRKY